VDNTGSAGSAGAGDNGEVSSLARIDGSPTGGVFSRGSNGGLELNRRDNAGASDVARSGNVGGRDTGAAADSGGLGSGPGDGEASASAVEDFAAALSRSNTSWLSAVSRLIPSRIPGRR
jgi:hypothetical protein